LKQERIVSRFDKWNCLGTEELAVLKKGIVDNKRDFLETALDKVYAILPTTDFLILIGSGGRYSLTARGGGTPTSSCTMI